MTRQNKNSAPNVLKVMGSGSELVTEEYTL